MIFKTILLFFLIGVLFGLGAFVYFARELPRPEMFIERQLALPTEIYDRSGETLLRTIYGEEKRMVVGLEQMPDHLINAVLATEDTNFYKHRGIDLRGVGRAILVNLKLAKPVQGASTISQQLIRSTFLTLEKTPERKVREIILAIELERRYSKDQILEWYLNQIPLGPNIYGVGQASKNFFNKSVEDLTMAESAILASLIRAPSFYNPFGQNLDRLMQRQAYVLERMRITGLAVEEEINQAKEEEVEFSRPAASFNVAPHFILYVENYLKQKYGESYLKTHGLRVYTTLDMELQEKAREIVKRGAEANSIYNAHNAALTALDPNNGEILAMVGSKDYFGESFPENCISGKDCRFEPMVNIATYGHGQQPGSAFKPFVYAAAIEKGYSSDSVFIDEETNFGRWGDRDYVPRNYDGLFRGAVTLKQSLAQSLNVPSVKVLLAAGIEESIATARAMGITTLTQDASHYGPALVLGAGETKLLDMASAYGAFATNGTRVPPVPILRIEDGRGNIVFENKPTPRRVLSVEAAEIINDILSDNNARAPMFGSNSRLHFPGYWVAAKTGTTDGFRDAWTVGYTRSISVGVWTGNNDNSTMSRQPGIVIAGPIWNEFMNFALSKGYY